MKPYAQQGEAGRPARRPGGGPARGGGTPQPRRRGGVPGHAPHCQTAAGRMTDAPLATPQATFSALRAPRHWMAAGAPQLDRQDVKRVNFFV